jgi:monoamine oxidase
MCGCILKKLSFDVKILEARSRIGGRVHTLSGDNYLLEAGGEHIGLNHPLLLYLFNHFKLSLETSSKSFENYASNILDGIIFVNGQDVELSEIFVIEKTINDILMRISDDADKIKYSLQPWLEPITIQKLDDVSLRDKFDEWNVCGKIRTILENQFENDNLGPIDNQSYLGLLCQIKGAGYVDTKSFWDVVELIKCSQGNQTLAKYLADDLEIIYQYPVKFVGYENGVMKAGISSSSYYESDFIIISVPPPIWNDIYFSPQFDLNMYKPQMGSAIKILPNIIECEEKLSNTTDFPSQNEKKFRHAIFAGGPNVINRVKEYILREINENNTYNFDMNNAHLVDWSNEKYTFAGYSYPAIGNSITVNKILYYPVKQFDNKLFFAGEHTQLNFAGFMEGAVQSGLRVANNILDQIYND